MFAQFSKTVLLPGGYHLMLAQGLPFLADWHCRRFYIDQRLGVLPGNTRFPCKIVSPAVPLTPPELT